MTGTSIFHSRVMEQLQETIGYDVESIRLLFVDPSIGEHDPSYTYMAFIKNLHMLLIMSGKATDGDPIHTFLYETFNQMLETWEKKKRCVNG